MIEWIFSNIWRNRLVMVIGKIKPEWLRNFYNLSFKRSEHTGSGRELRIIPLVNDYPYEPKGSDSIGINTAHRVRSRITNNPSCERLSLRTRDPIFLIRDLTLLLLLLPIASLLDPVALALLLYKLKFPKNLSCDHP